MKLTIDASVAVKWFVPELLFEEAQLLLDQSFDLYAPDILLAEFANVIWKKARRREIADSHTYVNELPYLIDIIDLYPVHNLVVRAVQFAEMLDHPVYDCLYLACAEATGSSLITADLRFSNKVRDTFQTVDVLYLGSDRFLNLITVAKEN